MKSSFSVKQWRAIRYFFELNDLLPRLSAYPMVRYEKADGTEEEKHISQIESVYANRKKEDEA